VDLLMAGCDIEGMPPLPNPKRELFAQGLAQGLDNPDAYEKAGYRRSSKNASRMKAEDDVRRRVEEIQQRNVEKLEKAADVSLASLLAELDQAAEIAIRTDDARSLVLVTQTRARLAGLWVEKSEQTMRVLDPSQMKTSDQDKALVEFMLRGKLTEQQLAELMSGKLPVLPAPPG
jgi:hypothetical protein